MFGYVVANMEKLSQEQQAIYKGYYCGICRSLKKQYGNFGRLTLNNDITFMVLLLADLFDPVTTYHEGRCVAHPAKRRTMTQNELIDYGASMNILLAYHNLMDDWHDNKNKAAKTAAKRLKRHVAGIAEQYPRQAKAVEACMEELSRLEVTAPRDLDTAANISGRILGELFVYKKDRWAEDCYTLGEALGRFVYWMDAYEDLPKDLKKGGYNPMTLICDREDYEQRVEEMLKDALGTCAIILERLPLVEHLDILRNVLYSGVWSKYRQLNKTKKKGEKE